MKLKKFLFVPVLASLAACNATMEKIAGDFFGNASDPVLLSSLTYVDAQMQACVDAAATANGWTATSQVTVLNCRGYSINDISDVTKFYNLSSIDLIGSTFADASPLATITSLTRVMFDSSAVTDLSSFSALTNLDMLNIPNTGISDISFLASLNNLKSVFLQGTTLSDASPLYNLSGLSDVGLPIGSTNADVVAIDAANPNLTGFAVNTSPLITDLSPLADNNLIYIQASSVGIVDFSFLQNSSNLELLTLTNLSVSDLSPLKDKNNIKILDLNGSSAISDISVLSNSMTNLESVNFFGNSFIPCSQLDSFETTYSSATVTRPTQCALFLASDIIGTWTIPGTGTADSTGFIAFLDDKNYMHVEDTDNTVDANPDGVEVGTYTLDVLTGSIVGTPLSLNGGSLIIDTNGTSGLSDSQITPTTVSSITATQLTVGDVNGSVVLNRLVDDTNSVTGTYYFGNIIDQTEFGMIAFTADGFYIFGQYGLDASSVEAMEWGTYSYDSANGDLTMSTSYTTDSNVGPNSVLVQTGGVLAGTALANQRIYTIDNDPGATQPLYFARSSLIAGVDVNANDIVGRTFNVDLQEVTLPGAVVNSATVQVVFTDQFYAEEVGEAWKWTWGVDELGKLRIGEVDTDGSMYNLVLTKQDTGEVLIENWSHPLASVDEHSKFVSTLNEASNNGATISSRGSSFDVTNVDDGTAITPTLTVTKGTAFSTDSVKNTIRTFSQGGTSIAEFTFYSDHGVMFNFADSTSDSILWWVSEQGELVIVASVGGGDMERYTLTNLNDGTVLVEGSSPPGQANVYAENLQGTLTFISNITF